MQCGLITAISREQCKSTRVLCSLFALAVSSVSTAAPSVYTQRDDNGLVVFSDAPLVNGALTRTSYQTDYGRPAARSSCLGLSAEDMHLRAAQLKKTIDKAAYTHGLKPELLNAIAEVESCFDPKAVSTVGAQGVMQLMPGTAKELGVSDSFNSGQNINGGASYFAQMLKRFNNDVELALAAYNAGPGAVDKYQGIPPYPETRNYVKKVLALYSSK